MKAAIMTLDSIDFTFLFLWVNADHLFGVVSSNLHLFVPLHPLLQQPTATAVATSIDISDMLFAFPRHTYISHMFDHGT